MTELMVSINLDRLLSECNPEQLSEIAHQTKNIVDNQLKVVLFRKHTVPLTDMDEKVLALVAVEFIYINNPLERWEDFGLWLKQEYPNWHIAGAYEQVNLDDKTTYQHK